jgi:hypothetical protein
MVVVAHGGAMPGQHGASGDMGTCWAALPGNGSTVVLGPRPGGGTTSHPWPPGGGITVVEKPCGGITP